MTTNLITNAEYSVARSKDDVINPNQPQGKSFPGMTKQ